MERYSHKVISRVNDNDIHFRLKNRTKSEGSRSDVKHWFFLKRLHYKKNPKYTDL